MVPHPRRVREYAVVSEDIDIPEDIVLGKSVDVGEPGHTEHIRRKLSLKYCSR